MNLKSFSYENIMRETGSLIKKYKAVLISSFIAALFAYTFWFTNKLVNHDDIKALFDLGVGLSSGRWMIDILAKLTITASMPWLNGLVGIVLLAAANCVIINIFEIKNTAVQVLLSALVIVFPGQMDMFSYMFTSTAYCLAFLFTVLSVSCFKKGGWLNFIFAAIFGTLMLATYQAYITLHATLLLLLLINELIKGEKSAGRILLEGVQDIGFILLILLLYAASQYTLMAITGCGMDSYGMNQTSGGSIFGRIADTYKSFFGMFRSDRLNIINSKISYLAHFICLLILIGELLVLAIRIKNPAKIGVLLLCAALLPLSMNAMYLVIAPQKMRAMMNFGFIGFYVLSAMIIDKTQWNKQKIVREAALWLLTVIIVNNVCIANKTALRMHLAYENAYSFFTTVLADIKMTPGFDEDCSIALIGYTDVHVYPMKEIGSDNVHGALKDIINVYSREWFIKYYCGFDADFLTDEEAAPLMETEEFKAMPRYPYYGSVKRIDDCIVVKLDEIPLE